MDDRKDTPKSWPVKTVGDKKVMDLRGAHPAHAEAVAAVVMSLNEAFTDGRTNTVYIVVDVPESINPKPAHGESIAGYLIRYDPADPFCINRVGKMLAHTLDKLRTSFERVFSHEKLANRQKPYDVTAALERYEAVSQETLDAAHAVAEAINAWCGEILEEEGTL